jgi:hypothetical protein
MEPLETKPARDDSLQMEPESVAEPLLDRNKAADAFAQLRRTVDYWYFCGEGADMRSP